MKRWMDLIAVILLAVMLSACGKQQREGLAGQGEEPGSSERIKGLEITGEKGNSENLEAGQSRFIDEKKMYTGGQRLYET